jgi:hypothetical protein
MKLPGMKLYVYGSDGRGIEHPENIIFKSRMGFDDYKKEISGHAVYIRLTAHDGYSLSVWEALSHGSEVIWNYPSVCCHFISADEKALISKMPEVKDLCFKRDLYRNLNSINWIKQHFNRETILATFIDKMIN